MIETKQSQITLDRKFLSSLTHYAYNDKSQFSIVLRKLTLGYNNNIEISKDRIKRDRQELIDEFKRNGQKEDPLTAYQLRMLEPIYRLIFTADEKLRKFYNELKQSIEQLGIKLPHHGYHEDPSKCQFQIVTQLYRIFKETNQNPDDSFFMFKRQLKKEFQQITSENDEFYQKIIRLFCDIDNRKTQILNSPVLNENNLEQVVFEYGINNPLCKKYKDAYTFNKEPIKVDFKFGYGEHDRIDKVKTIYQEHKNYVKEFFDKFKNELLKKSPEFWQLLLFDVLKHLCNKKKTNAELQSIIMDLLENAEAAEYLITFRMELVKYLYKQKFLKKDSEDGKGTLHQQLQHQQHQSGMTNYHILKGMDEKEIEKEQKLGLRKTVVGGRKIYDEMQYDPETKDYKVIKSDKQKYNMDDEFTELDFIKMDQNLLLKHIPTLQKIENPEYLMFRIDPMAKMKAEDDQLIMIKDLPEFPKRVFEGVQTLNLLQSKSFKIAYNTDENLLLSAPTGAGKTNVALMTIIREVEKHIDKETFMQIDPDYKIVYVSPMKALASEIVEKFTSRLKKHGVNVRELTGDIQLSRPEMDDTQIIVTTPEKWDVITRKNNSVADQLRLLIIDEIHLLNDERGPVLECLVARTLQHIERAQRSIRLLGLSATLPNYLDVAAFLHVKRDNVFFFDQRHRPVPLLQKFIGIKEPGQNQNKHMAKRKKLDVYNDICYEFTKSVLEHHKQVLIFVHSRKETVTTAQYFIERSKLENDIQKFMPLQKDLYNLPKISDKILQKTVPNGIGFHHAGMLRRDRNIMEKMFLEGNVKLLVATSTLAWGVNLPAYSVIIKGTDIYDPSKGGIQNLSVLDVQQMFGRAGRPQFDNNGEATLLTDITKVNQYMGQMNNASYLESKLPVLLKEALNAEIVLGNVTSQKEAFDWINHTFYCIRLKRNPFNYGCRAININKDLATELYISERIETTLNELDNLRLVRYDRKNGYLSSTELGRITSHFYVKCETMNIFCQQFGINLEGNEDIEDFMNKKNEYKTDLQILRILAQAKEFENIKLRNEEYAEIKKIHRNCWALDEELDLTIKKSHATDKNLMTDEAVIETPEKVIILINGYLFKERFDNFSLVSDSQFIVQNSIRLLRCLLEMSMKKNMAFNVEIIHKWCKLIENRIVPGQSPLRQFCRENFQGYNTFKSRKEHKEGYLSSDLVDRLEEKNMFIDQIRESTLEELAYLLDTKKNIAQVVKKFVSYLPQVEVNYVIKPIAQTVLKMDVFVRPSYTFNPRWHSKSEVFWIIVDNEEEILHMESFIIKSKNLFEKKDIEINFFIPFRDSKVTYYRMSVVSDTWITEPEYQAQINLKDIYIKGEKKDFTELLDLNPLPIKVLHDDAFERLYPMKYFNPNQTQVFHALFHSDENVLIGSPTGSGKTIMAEFAMLRAFKLRPNMKIVYVAPLKALAKERLKDWMKKFSDSELDKEVIELTGDYTPDMDTLMKADILITTPEKWDGISRNWNNRAYVQRVCLVIFDEIHLLGQDRGPVIEVIVSRMNLIASKTKQKVRMVGLSTAMANGSDVADWFGCPKYFFFNFRPHVRPVPVTIYFDGFSEKHYCPRMATMNKPCFNAIKKWGEGRPVLIFVSSRRQTRLTALDLIAFAMHETAGEFSPYLKCGQEDIDVAISLIKDEYLAQTLSFGIGMHHAGLTTDDRKIVEELFSSSKIQVLIATSTLAWGVNYPARLVIIKGTEFFDPKSKRYVDMPVTDILQMIGRAGRPQFDDKGVACIFVEQSKKNFYRKYLNDPFPIESSLVNQLHDHFNAEISCGSIVNKQQCIDWITYTYFFRRLLKNPAFYNLESNDSNTIKKFLINLVDDSIKRLQDHQCIKINQEDEYSFEPQFLGSLAAFYYVKHETIFYFNEKLTKNISIPDLIRLISYSKEFEEIPLRHNEENLNEELAKQCPLKCNKKAMDSSQEKTYLLFQAHIFRLTLPIRDYLTDTKIVIDSAVRFIHALIDLSAEKQYLKTSLNLMLIMQMIIQGIWFEQCALINIPYFDPSCIKQLGCQYMCELIELQQKGKLDKMLLKIPEFQRDKSKVKEVISAIESVPIVSINVSLQSFNSEDLQKNTTEESGKLIEGGEAIATINLKRENNQCPLQVKIQATSKIKDASWWAIIGNEFEDKLLCLKKIYFKNTLKRDLQIQLPSSFKDSPQLKFYLISDSYLGIDQVVTLQLLEEKKKTKNNQEIWL